MELEPELEMWLEAQDLERHASFDPNTIDTIPHIITEPSEKIRPDKLTLSAGKEEAIEHRPPGPAGIVTEHWPDISIDKDSEEAGIEMDTAPGLERIDAAKKHAKTKPKMPSDSFHGEVFLDQYPSFFMPDAMQQSPSMRTSRAMTVAQDTTTFMQSSPKRKSHPSVSETHHIGPKKVSSSIVEQEKASRKATEGENPQDKSSTVSKRSIWSGAPFSASSSTSSSFGVLEPEASTGSKRIDLKVDLDMLSMRLESVIRSKDEILMRWATHEALRDRNLSLLEAMRTNVETRFGELKSKLAAREEAAKAEVRARKSFEEAHMQLIIAEHERAECESKYLGDNQMCSELERRIKDHTAGINYAMAVKQKRDLEEQDLRLKIELRELELRRLDETVEETSSPQIYHPDYSTSVQVPETLPSQERDDFLLEDMSNEAKRVEKGGETSGNIKRLSSSEGQVKKVPIVSTQSVVTKETPLPHEELIQAALRHHLPLPSTINLFSPPPLPMLTSTIPPLSSSNTASTTSSKMPTQQPPSQPNWKSWVPSFVVPTGPPPPLPPRIHSPMENPIVPTNDPLEASVQAIPVNAGVSSVAKHSSQPPIDPSSSTKVVEPKNQLYQSIPIRYGYY